VDKYIFSQALKGPKDKRRWS